jgi:sugar/nucleoside kinase (ribokinase family)
MTPSHFEDLRQRLLVKLEHAEVDLDVVTMPDFFLDHSSSCNFDARRLTKRILSVAARGGGEISNVSQTLEVGGNAAICTLALANLGSNVHPIMKTDALGLQLMRYFYQTSRIDLTRIKLTGSLSPTIILELRTRGGATNVMLGDASNITPFGFEDLDSVDLATIAKARYVCVFNWLYNKKGTELAEKVFGYCRTNSRARTFFDASDPRPRLRDLSDLNRKVLRNELIDIWGLNENEALVFARLFDRKLKRRSNNTVLAAGKVIAANTGAKIYLHTADYSASVKGDQITLVPAFAIVANRGTGAGDSWNAGIMVADALGLTDEEGLLFANAVAGRYATFAKRVYSTVPEIMGFLRKPALKLKRIREA